MTRYRCFLASLAVLLTAACAAAPAAPTATSPTPPASRSGPRETPPASANFDKTSHSTSEPSSIWVIVNKTHPLTPVDFRPELRIVRGYQVATKAAGPLRSLLRAGERAGHQLKIASAFRSYDYQQGIHAQLVAEQGQRAADKVSARPGHSEHQTGLAIDLQTWDDPECAISSCFGKTPAGVWLSNHAWEYGFIVRYAEANQDITGYSPEPWHFRYVGRPLSWELHRAGAGSLEEFFGVGGGDYPEQ